MSEQPPIDPSRSMPIDLSRSMPIDLSRSMRWHVVAIGGAAMNGIATLLAGLGHRVTGSDLRPSAVLEQLRANGIDARVGHRAENVGDAEALAVSTAVPADNPEVLAARERGIPVYSRADVLVALTGERRTVAVAGTHGKTTCSSMTALALREAGLRPSFLIGGQLHQTGSGVAWDEGEWLVVEADESDGTFLRLSAEVPVVTSVEPDHLEHWGGFEPLVEAFTRFASGGGGSAAGIVRADDDLTRRLAAEAGATTYGLGEGLEYRAVGVERSGLAVRFRVEHAEHPPLAVELATPYLHNVAHATAAVAVGHRVGADPAAIAAGLARFTGVARRFQFRGERDGVTFVDDYAHLPAEVSGALATASTLGHRRVVCVFQPHRYSRTATLWRQFADAFEGADLLVVTDVYASDEAPRPGITGKLVLDAVLDAHPQQAAAYLPTRAALRAYLLGALRPGDLCLTLGAGDLTSLPDELLSS